MLRRRDTVACKPFKGRCPALYLDGDQMNSQLLQRGIRLKSCRQKREMKLKDLAEKTGLSVGYLSKIENGTGNPSLDNIQKICYALEISPNELLATKDEEEKISTINKDRSYVLRAEERCLLYDFSGKMRLESIFEGSKSFKLNALTISEDHSEKYSTFHGYDEICINTSGLLQLQLEGEDAPCELRPGDCIKIRANTHYTVVNISKQISVSYWIEMNPE